MASRFPHPLPLLVILLALILKSAVPYGYMPDARALADGMMRIRICTAMGAQDIWVDKNLNKVDPTHQSDKPQDEGDCVFASGLHFKPADLSLAAADIIFMPLRISFRAVAAAIPAIFNPAAPTRAPPALS